jgi:hypothetical protein
MERRVEAYLAATRELEAARVRCDGLIADIAALTASLRRWQECVASGGSEEALEEALRGVLGGEGPSRRMVRAAMEEWVERAREASRCWGALTSEERACLARPAVAFEVEGWLGEG